MYIYIVLDDKAFPARPDCIVCKQNQYFSSKLTFLWYIDPYYYEVNCTDSYPEGTDRVTLKNWEWPGYEATNRAC